ncbi:MAG: magnesium-translocating P-type ATPase, partial [Thermomicrobiales bacterium]|nr:magnesium-translocating P-type ATPase [Thermomicrobiales bacterium]
DVVLLNAGDIIPGDCRLLEASSLLVDEAVLTGEAYPVEKATGRLAGETPLNRRSNAVFLGSHVVSGRGEALVARTGSDTELGRISLTLGKREQPTGFERGITGFGFLLVRATVVLVVAIFLVNLLLHRPFVDSLLFSLALAVGLTPQLLPAIVTISLAAGARRMAGEEVVVKRLNAIEDIGGMTLLYTDKTGTITEGTVSLAAALDAQGDASEPVQRLAWLNARFQRGYANPLDTAIIADRAFDDAGIEPLDEVPYDFARKRLSVLVRERGVSTLVTKGAFEPLLATCATVATNRGVTELRDVRAAIDAQFARLSGEGYRVLGIATKSMGDATACRVEDECAMTFAGFLAFADPAKEGAADAIAELAGLGIAVRMITGDNRLAAAHAGVAVGLDATTVLTGSEVHALADADLVTAVAGVSIFAEIEPVQKERIVRALRDSGSVVGYLGDGINDAAALHEADVGISVDTAVDVAKQAADIVLLNKHLAVVADGVRLGRQTFANTLKYVNVTTSANFGNMLSMAVAAAFLPFLPMLPRQILLLNFLSDIPGTTISGDRVDPEQVEQPQRWDIARIRTFMLVFGSISSLFDITTFAVLRVGFDAGAELFRSGWFVESVMTELAVMLVLRTRRPFMRSRPGRALLASSIVIALVTVGLPFSPLAATLGLRDIPGGMLLALALITASYVAATELAKWAVHRRFGAGPAQPVARRSALAPTP